jgi:hypothetical protein
VRPCSACRASDENRGELLLLYRGRGGRGRTELCHGGDAVVIHTPGGEEEVVVVVEEEEKEGRWGGGGG